ncbi:hypothetical protein VPH35_120796 [Triticum aestivum]|uniref:uncharacterized protein n=1 Tax=Triticum aestivum TaxID=4565 RepID=UPI001D0284F8|nr:uncharacterized protein LOC123152438 [Triticum aestivum]
MDQIESLPDDALVGILGRLPPRDLAACRCVRKAWRAVIDDRRLLLLHLLPRAVHGVFFNYGDRMPHFFARPSSTRQPAVDGDLGFLPYYGGASRQIVDHCNGLLLYRDLRTLCVINPATRLWEDLPWLDDGCDAYLVFDPAESPHYQVFSVPREPDRVPLNNESNEGSKEPMESPPEQSDEEGEEQSDGEGEDEPDEEGDSPTSLASPSSWTLNVFSSSTRQWQKRLFVREAQALESMTNMPLDQLYPTSPWGPKRCRQSVYWQGSLYLHFHGVFVLRLSLSDGKYRVIELPTNIEESVEVRTYIGKSEKGVYFAAIHDGDRPQVWNLMESSERIDWMSKKPIDIDLSVSAIVQSGWSDHFEVTGKTWIFDDVNDVDGNNRKIRIENLDWDSDDDNVVNIEDCSEYFGSHVFFLGFHPYKEVVFLGLRSYRRVVAMACHLNSIKIQYLGRLHPRNYICDDYIQGPFFYTPCMIGYLLKRFKE